MIHKNSVDIGVNWVQWLRDFAERYYVWDAPAHYHRVSGLNPPALQAPAENILKAWDGLPALQEQQPHLRHNKFVRDLSDLSTGVKMRIHDFFAQSGLRDFEFLDFGGRAITYRAHHTPSGQIRVARMEGVHQGRKPRPDHPVVLQPYQSNQGRMKPYGGIKLEVLPEIVPLSKAFRQYAAPQVPLLKEAYYKAAVDLGWGTNLMYAGMFDRDAEFQNIGIRPDGKLVSFDPEIITGAPAQNLQRHFKTPKLLRDASAQQLLLIYPEYR